MDDEATDAYTRLMELASEDKDWATVARNADRYLSVNPLVPLPYRFQARAATELNDLPTATLAWRTLLQLDVPDLPEAHYQLAQLLHRRDQDVEAYGHLLLTLEDTPRYQEALKLLAELKPKVGENYWIPPPPNPAAAKAAQSAAPSLPAPPAITIPRPSRIP